MKKTITYGQLAIAYTVQPSGGFRGGSEVSMEPPFLAKSKIDRYTKADQLAQTAPH